MHIHFIGNNGVSMRALEALTRTFGDSVTGSDAATTGHSPKNVGDAQLVVYTNAVPQGNCELASARERGIPAVERAEYLGMLARRYKTVVAIAGCHGKTTATAMTGKAMAALDPTVHAGVAGGLTVGGRGTFVTEACEYKSSFLHLAPDVGIVLNVGYDHPDYYKDKSELVAAYRAFVQNCRTVIINGDDRDCRSLAPRGAITFGLNAGCDYRATDIITECGARTFTCRHAGKTARVKLNVPGAHNVYNALAALAAADTCGVPLHIAAEGLAAFTGIPRRFERKGEADGKQVVCDYAHHPDEIAATIAAARELFQSVAVVFQPHTYSRTEALLDGFAKALAAADTVVLAPIFPAREKPNGTTSRTLCKRIKELNKNTYCFDGFADIIRFCKMLDERAVLFLGAGDIDKACDEFVREGN